MTQTLRLSLASAALLFVACGDDDRSFDGGSSDTSVDVTSQLDGSASDATLFSDSGPDVPRIEDGGTPDVPLDVAVPQDAPGDAGSDAWPSDAGPGLEGVISGIVTVDDGAVPPEMGETVFYWVVTSGDDYAYVNGLGEFTNTRFEIALPSPMPPDAVNSYGVGVGMVFAMMPDTAPAEGRITRGSPFIFNVVGATPRFALIYRAPDADVAIIPWIRAFPIGFSCGEGVPAPAGITFDTFTPVDCEQVELRLGDLDAFDFVNWT